MSAAPTTQPLAPAAPEPAAPRDVRPRLESVDLLRGAVMVVMVLDHARDFFTNPRAVNPTDLDRTTAVLFLTRWVTHFCAPVFVFLAGTGAALAGARGKPRGELSRFLLTRGLWLVVLELTVIRLGLTFNLNYQMIPLTVIWAIGWSMVALSALVYLPTRAIAAFGLAMIAGHNLLDGIKPEAFGPLRPLWVILHAPGPIALPGGGLIFAMYALVPWVGVMAAGYAFGPLLGLEPRRRRRVLLGLGLGLTALFVALRAANVYGDPRPWQRQPSGLFTLFSFLNCNKYPPSLLYLLMTLGPAIAALALFDRGIGPVGRPLATLGRVPLFYYILQWFALHALAVVVAWATGRPYAFLLTQGPFQAPDAYGYPLWVSYLMWPAAVALLYVPCRWFADLKRRRRDAWLSYF